LAVLVGVLTCSAIAKPGTLTTSGATSAPSAEGAASRGPTDQLFSKETRVVEFVEAQRKSLSREEKKRLAIQDRRNPPKQPLNEVLHANDLTLQLNPLDEHQVNDLKHVAQHHKMVETMAEAGGLGSEALTHLKASLKKHMREYQRAKGKMERYLQQKRTLPQDEQLIREHEIAETARALHHTFYRIKMRVVLSAKSDHPFEDLREVMKGPRFSDEDRQNFEAEIKEHIADREAFAKAQQSRNSAFRQLATKEDTDPVLLSRRKTQMRGAIIRKQKSLEAQLQTLRERIAVHAGEL